MKVPNMKVPKTYVSVNSFAAIGARKVGRKVIAKKKGVRGGVKILFSPFTLADHKARGSKYE